MLARYIHESNTPTGSCKYHMLCIVLSSRYCMNIARQTRFIVSHQRPLPLRPAVSIVIIAFQAMTRPLLMAVVPQICRVHIAFAGDE